MAVSAAIAPAQQNAVHSVGDLSLIALDVTFSGSYATGGDALDFTSFMKRSGGSGRVLFVISQAKGGFDFEYDFTNKKLKVFSGGAEIAAAAYAAGLTTGVLRMVILGR